MTNPLPVFVTKAENATWHLLVRVQPEAKHSEIAGEQEGRLRIRLTAPAVDNKANKALVAFVAKILGLRPSRVQLLSGGMSRQKKLCISSEAEPEWSRLICQ